MKKQLTGKQIRVVAAVSLIISLLMNIPDLVKGFQDGWNSVNYSVTGK